ncbi:uncharacterized protein LOC143138965 [Alosa pseudoharengus]|uniref:uncharacterized protein LOC143138965 n=1 Tax=Alosa pseudoharengus TaxID=34774 RepID=UPI003F8B376E
MCIIKLFYRFGAPKRILTDNGREFVNQINDGLCKYLGIKHSLCAPYHPQTNGLVEKLNGTIQRCLSKLVDDSIEDLVAEELVFYAIQRQDEIFEIVHGNAAKVREKIQKRKQQQGTHLAIIAGDRVLRQNIRSQQRKGGKLDPHVLVPYTVVKVDGTSVDLMDDRVLENIWERRMGGKLCSKIGPYKIFTWDLEYLKPGKKLESEIQCDGCQGCHSAWISHLIQEARGSQGNLTVVWLDLANAYGSMPHSLINKAMEQYHIPDKIRQMINSYLGSFKLRFQTAKFTTTWQPLEKGIVTGCTVSPILFIMGMNLLITTAAAEAKGPVTAAGSRQPPLRGFMDDLTITTTTHVQARWILKTLGAVASWARMAFKPRKSRSMVIRRGKLTEAFELHVQGEQIPTIRENPIKCLGKWYDDTLSDRNNISDTVNQADEWLRRIDKSGLPGKFKSWIYQHGLLPRLMWLLTVYQIPVTAVEGVERKVNKHLRRWLGIPPSFTAVGLYIRSGQLQLPFSSVVEEFKVAKCRVAMMLRDSKDEQVSNAGVTTRTGRKWAADTAVRQAESSLELRDIIGNVCMGRQGLGTSHFTQWRKASIQQRREMVQAEVRHQEEETRKAKAVELATQGTWTRWDLPNRRVTWTELWRLEPFRVSFLLRSVYDTLPSPANLARWGLREDPLCKLCGKRGTLAHILAGCQIALAQGRYRWRHDQVLRVMADIFEQARRRPQPTKPQVPSMQFVRAGEKPSSVKRARTNILLGAQGWEMSVDLGKKLTFPSIVQTTLRPDVVIWSEQAKKIILVELTVPWEEGCEEAHERKSLKYQDLIMDCKDKGWQAWLFPVEVGCRGFPAKSMWSVLTALGISGKERKTAVRRIGEAAERASCWVWFKREEGGWRPGVDGQ